MPDQKYLSYRILEVRVKKLVQKLGNYSSEKKNLVWNLQCGSQTIA